MPLALLAAAPGASAGAAVERIKASGKLTLGYDLDRPFSYKDASGNPAGYAIDLCGKIADALKAGLALPSLSVSYVPLSGDAGLEAVAQGKVDILCAPTVTTLRARREVSFSIPVFASGVGVVVRADASSRLKEVLSGHNITTPLWRANADQLLRQSTVALIPGTRTEHAINQRMVELELIPKLVPVNDVETGVARVLEGSANMFFADRPSLLDAVNRSNDPAHLQVLERSFTRETLAFALPRDDEDFRLAVDSALSKLYWSEDFRAVFSRSFGPISDNTLLIFRASAPLE
jgi:ABC-type amino acid transport substrate-binding protein